MENTPLKVFISYTHKDETYLDQLKSHLAPLVRKGLIETWHDRQLVAGDKLDDAILTELHEADLIVCLISSDYIASYYCYEVELEEAFKCLENGDIKVIPVVLRSCAWQETHLSEYLCTPTDGKPVATWDDEDSAFLDVVQSIKRAAESLKKKELESKPLSSAPLVSVYEFQKGFTDYLLSTDISFQHRNKDSVLIDDIFIYQDLKDLDVDLNQQQLIKSSQRLSSLNDEAVLVLGSEQSGKTALLKVTTTEVYKNGSLPILLNCENISSTNLEKLVSQALRNQYEGLDFEGLMQASAKKVLLLDNFSKTKLNEKHQAKLLESITNTFDNVVVTADESFRFKEYEFRNFDHFRQFEIMDFGHVKRSEIIKKWNSIGVEETISSDQLHALIDRSTVQIDSIIRRNIVPSKPLFVLTILQTLETTQSSDHTLTSYGHCYNYLIQSAFKSVRLSSELVDSFINLLTYLSYFIYKSGKEHITTSEYEVFKSEYQNDYLIPDDEISILKKSRIIVPHEDGFRFSHKYVFYFYSAKYIAENLSETEGKESLRYLCENLHTDKNANILIFVTHHTKKQEVIDEILANTICIFDDVKEAVLSIEDTEFMSDVLEHIPALVIEQRDVETERQRRLETRDKIDKFSLEDDQQEETESSEELVGNNVLADINRSAKVIELIGQILRNRHGSLKIGQLQELAESAYSVGLRFLHFYLDLVSSQETEIINFVKKLLEENTELTDEELTKKTKQFYLRFCYGMTFSIIKKISESTGHERIIDILDKISDEKPDSVAIKLINLMTRLEFTKVIPKKHISELAKEFSGNSIAERLLKELVIQHLYLHYLDVQDKQWIASTLGISMDVQRQITAQKKTKMLM